MIAQNKSARDDIHLTVVLLALELNRSDTAWLQLRTPAQKQQ